MLATLSGVAESTIKNLEVCNHQPTRSTIARLCEALDLPSPLSGAELRISLDEVDYPTAVKTLRAALDEYITRVRTRQPLPISRRLQTRPTGGNARRDRSLRRWPEASRAAPKDTHRGHMTDAKKTRAPRWARRRGGQSDPRRDRDPRRPLHATAKSDRAGQGGADQSTSQSPRRRSRRRRRAPSPKHRRPAREPMINAWVKAWRISQGLTIAKLPIGWACPSLRLS